jgi:hypothetical protein
LRRNQAMGIALIDESGSEHRLVLSELHLPPRR